MLSIEQELITDLTTELEISDPKFNLTLLTSKVNAVVREVISARRYYQANYSDLQIEKDIRNYYSQCRAIILYDYNKIGLEGEENHTESGVAQGFSRRNNLFSGIVPISRI